jgi:hypothetical protein
MEIYFQLFFTYTLNVELYKYVDNEFCQALECLVVLAYNLQTGKEDELSQLQLTVNLLNINLFVNVESLKLLICLLEVAAVNLLVVRLCNPALNLYTVLAFDG